MSLHDAPIYLKKSSVQRVDLTAASGNTAIREDLCGSGWLRVKAVGGDIQCYLSANDEDAVVLNELSAADAMGYDIIDGQVEDFQMTSETRLVWASSGAGYAVLLKTNKAVGR